MTRTRAASPECKTSSRFRSSTGSAVAVVADKFWSAKQARDRLKVEWDLSRLERADSSQLSIQYKSLARVVGKVAVQRGDDRTIDSVAPENQIVAEFEFPYLAHTAMETAHATVRSTATAPSMGPVSGADVGSSRHRRGVGIEAGTGHIPHGVCGRRIRTTHAA